MTYQIHQSLDGSTFNAEPHHRLTKGSSLSYGVEDNEGNVEPQVSSWGFTPPSAIAALGQSQELASPPASQATSLSSRRGSASHRQEDEEEARNGECEDIAKNEVEEECGGERAEFEPRPISESAVEHIRLQLWDRRPVRGTPFRGKAEIRLDRQRITGFINFTESRKWYVKRQDTSYETQWWYDWYREAVAPAERAHNGDKAYCPRIGHMIRQPEHGKPQVQIPQAGGILSWDQATPIITLMINDYAWTFEMRKSKHAGRPKSPGWFAYYQPKHEEEEDEEYS